MAVSEQHRRLALATGTASAIGAAMCRTLAGPGMAIQVHTRTNRARAQAAVDAVRAGYKYANLRRQPAGRAANRADAAKPPA